MWTFVYIVLAAYIAYRIGKRTGEQRMYQLCKNAAQVQREFFSRLTTK